MFNQCCRPCRRSFCGLEGKFYSSSSSSSVSDPYKPQVYVAGIIYFGLNCALGSLSAFLPTIISTMGFGSRSRHSLKSSDAYFEIRRCRALPTYGCPTICSSCIVPYYHILHFGQNTKQRPLYCRRMHLWRSGLSVSHDLISKYSRSNLHKGFYSWSRTINIFAIFPRFVLPLEHTPV